MLSTDLFHHYYRHIDTERRVSSTIIRGIDSMCTNLTTRRISGEDWPGIKRSFRYSQPLQRIEKLRSDRHQLQHVHLVERQTCHAELCDQCQIQRPSLYDKLSLCGQPTVEECSDCECEKRSPNSLKAKPAADTLYSRRDRSKRCRCGRQYS